MFQITSKITGKTLRIDRDVRTVHPDWVHEQLGTVSEADLQEFLDCMTDAGFFSGARYLGPDECGVGLTDEAREDYLAARHTIHASFDRDGTSLDCSQAEVLGDAFGQHYSLDAAIKMADFLQDDLEDTDIDPSTAYRVHDATGRCVYTTR